jgi:hypothetical protein
MLFLKTEIQTHVHILKRSTILSFWHPDKFQHLIVTNDYWNASISKQSQLNEGPKKKKKKWRTKYLQPTNELGLPINSVFSSHDLIVTF